MARIIESVRELLTYSMNVDAPALHNLFIHFVKQRTPFMGFLDFTYLFAKAPVNLVVKRYENTVRFYIKGKSSMDAISHLLFPFKLSEPSQTELEVGSMFPFPKIFMFNGMNFLDYMIQEDVIQMKLRIFRFLGKFYTIGSAIEKNGKKNIVFTMSPERFMELRLDKHPSIYIEVLEPIPKTMYVSSKCHMFEGPGITLGVDNYDVFQQTLAIGQSGSGKSKWIYLLVRSLEKVYGDNARIVLLDPHGEFKKYLPHAKIVDFVHNFIEPLDVGGEKSPLMTQLIAQLISNVISQENKYAERVLFYAIHLLSSIDQLDLKTLSMLLTDPSSRMEYVSRCDVDEVKRFFDQEYQDIYMHHFNDAILPIVNFVGEYELYLGKKKKREELYDIIKNNRLVVITFDPHFFGKRMIQFLAGAIINQMYILAITEKFDKKTMLIVDEFPRVETIVVKDILAETRKFNLYMCLSLQYLGQLNKKIFDSIISNMRNIVSFKMSREDAKFISSIMEIKVEEFFRKSLSPSELEESKRDMFIRLNERECIVRLFEGNKYLIPMRLRCLDVDEWEKRYGPRPPPRDQGFDVTEGPEVPPAHPVPREEASDISARIPEPVEQSSLEEPVQEQDGQSLAEQPTQEEQVAEEQSDDRKGSFFSKHDEYDDIDQLVGDKDESDYRQNVRIAKDSQEDLDDSMPEDSLPSHPNLIFEDDPVEVKPRGRSAKKKPAKKPAKKSKKK